eukprot:2155101-Amphidinium_carterae.1
MVAVQHVEKPHDKLACPTSAMTGSTSVMLVQQTLRSHHERDVHTIQDHLRTLQTITRTTPCVHPEHISGTRAKLLPPRAWQSIMQYE